MLPTLQKKSSWMEHEEAGEMIKKKDALNKLML
jgi:hypothetical protein